MSNVKRVYVEKKPEFAVAAKGLRHEIRHYLGLQDVTNVRVLIRYDAENISEETFEKACNGVFAEPPVDFLYKEEFPKNETDKCFSVEFLPGQFDQRADSAEQCIRFIKEDETPVIRTAVTYVIEGGVSDEELQAIKNHCINPVDSREAVAEKPETLVDLIVVNYPNAALNNISASMKIKNFHDVFIAGNNYPELKEKKLTLADLLHYPILMLDKNSTTNEFLHRLFQQHQLDLVPEIELTSNDLLIDLARIGLGIAFIPDYCLSENKDDIFKLDMEEEMPERSLVIAYNEQLPLAKPAQEFLNYFEEQ